MAEPFSEEDKKAQARQDLINRARAVGLPDEATEAEVSAKEKPAKNESTLSQSKPVKKK